MSAILGFVFWVIVARFYSPEDIGIASAVIASMGLVANFASLGLGIGLIRFLSHSVNNANSMLNTAFTTGAIASVVAALIYLAGLNFWSPTLLIIRENPIYIAAFIIFAVAATLSGLVTQTFVAERRASFSLVYGFTSNVLKLSLVIVLRFLHSLGIFGSWGIASCVALLLCFLFLHRVRSEYRFSHTINKGVLNDMLPFSFANYINGLFWTAPSLVLPIIVINLLGADTNAYFSITWAVASIFSIIPGSISSSLFAEGSYDNERLWLHVRRTLKMMSIILVPLIVLTLIFGDKLLLIFGSNYSANGATLLRLLVLSALPLTINTVYLDIKRVQRKLGIIIIMAVFIAMVSLALSYLLMPRMGINGAGVAWLATQSVTAVVIAANFLRRKQMVT